MSYLCFDSLNQKITLEYKNLRNSHKGTHEIEVLDDLSSNVILLWSSHINKHIWLRVTPIKY